MTIENKITGPGYYPQRPRKVRDFEGTPYDVMIKMDHNGTWDRMPWQGAGTYQCLFLDNHILIAGWVVADVDGRELYRHLFPKPRILNHGDTIALTLRHPAKALVGRSYAANRWTFTKERS